MPPLYVLIKPVSGRCNLSCRYCFYRDVAVHRETADFGVMDDETVNALIRKAFIYAEESVVFSFQGGEPTLAGLPFFERFAGLVDSYNTRRLSVSYLLQTNATRLTDAFCAFLKQRDFLVGVSLDGTREVHNRYRAGSYDAAMQGIARLQKFGVAFNILCTVTDGVGKHASAVWRALAPYGYLQFTPCMDFLDGGGAYALCAEAYGEFLIQAFDLYREAFFTAKPVRERRFDNYVSMLLGAEPEGCAMCCRCGRYFVCEADGSVYPCDFYVLDDWRLGNICETSFARMAQSERMAAFAAPDTPKTCGDCPYFSLCRGGCRRDRTDGANRYCESYKRFFAERGEALRRLAEEVAKSFS